MKDIKKTMLKRLDDAFDYKEHSDVAYQELKDMINDFENDELECKTGNEIYERMEELIFENEIYIYNSEAYVFLENNKYADFTDAIDLGIKTISGFANYYLQEEMLSLLNAMEL